MARSTRARQEEEAEASRRRAERKKRIKEAREKRQNGELRAKPNIKPIVKKTMEDERAEHRAEREALKKVRRDLEQVREDRKFKVSDVTLNYLLKNRYVTKSQYSYYKGIPEEPEERKTISANGVIETVNYKLLFYIL